MRFAPQAVATTGCKNLQGIATHGPNVLSAGVDTVPLELPTMESTTLPDGYLLPDGTTMADVRRLDRELLAGEGLNVDRLPDREGGEDDRPTERERIVERMRRELPELDRRYEKAIANLNRISRGLRPKT